MNNQNHEITIRLGELEAHNLQLNARIEAAETRFHTAQRRLRFQAGLALAAVVGAILVSPANRAALAQGYGVTLSSLNTRMIAVEAKTQFQTADSTAKSTTFSGCNLFVNDGGGNGFTFTHNAAGDGLGNLIVGYNDLRGTGDDRSGVHNLVVGLYNNYSSYGGLVAGSFNEVDAPSCTVSGGEYNVANKQLSSISGGTNNLSSGYASSVTSGEGNIASGDYSAVTGGDYNHAYGTAASVTGGGDNAAVSSGSTVSGGALVTPSAASNSWAAGTFHSP